MAVNAMVRSAETIPGEVAEACRVQTRQVVPGRGRQAGRHTGSSKMARMQWQAAKRRQVAIPGAWQVVTVMVR